MAGPEAEWRQRVLGALGAVVVVGLVIGGVLGAVTYSTARITGLAEGPAEASAAVATSDEREIGQPVAADTSPSASSEPESADGEPEQDASPHAEKKKQKHDRSGHQKGKHRGKKKHARAGKGAHPTLVASSDRVRRMGRIHLAGRYRGHNGARLVVQRFERGHWARFPVTATVRGGRFRTWVASGQRGKNRFRVVDTRSRRASDPVTVRIR